MRNSLTRTDRSLSPIDRISGSIDNLIGMFSPYQAAKRRYFRFISKHMLGAYRGAEGGRLRGSWVPGGGSADQDLLQDLPELRERSRDLVRNDGIASGAMTTIVFNIIGTGIKLQSHIDRDAIKINEEYADILQSKIEAIWNRWTPCADAGKRQTFYGIQELSERSRFINGESIIVPLMISDKNRPYRLALQTIESDRLETPSELSSNRNIRKGIEIGAYGEPVAYWIRKTHPGDHSYGTRFLSGSKDNFYRYPAFRGDGLKNFLHLYHLLRPGQTRGEPFMAPVINLFKDRFEYMEAELIAARIAACFAIFVKKQNAADLAYARSSAESGSTQRIEEMSPGIIEYLNAGEDISTFNPQRPGGTFEPFMIRILRDIASGLNIPYEILAKDFSRANYSNLRGALLEARRFFMTQQKMLAESLCQPVLELLLEEAYLNGELPILDFYSNRAAYVKTRWICPGWQWVDPQNEIKASVASVDNNLSSLSEELASQGMDWEETLEQRAREQKRIKDLEAKFGIKLKTEKSGDVKESMPQGEGGDNDKKEGWEYMFFKDHKEAEDDSGEEAA